MHYGNTGLVRALLTLRPLPAGPAPLPRRFRRLWIAAPALLVALSCAYDPDAATEPVEAAPEPPVPGAVLANHLIQPGETHFTNLWQLTFSGENAEAYWSFSDDKLSLQARELGTGNCDKIYVTGADGQLRQVSNGMGVTTCAFYMPGDQEVLYASTQSHDAGCPSKPKTTGYTWMLWPDYDIFVSDLKTGDERTLVSEYGYDAEATVSPRGDRIVFTSTRSGDLELWTCDLEGKDLFRVTDELGYDGGAFHSHDGRSLVFRTTAWTPGNEVAEQEQYRDLLQHNQVRPHHMDIYTIAVDGTNRSQVTSLGGASFAPYFTPDDTQIIFSSNHHDTDKPQVDFDIFLINVDGTGLEQITFYNKGIGKKFDSFPMFSHNGRYLAFSSNRGNGKPGETNVFIAEWAP